MANRRIDKILVDRELAADEKNARALVMAGVVLVNEKRVEKSSETFADDADIRIKDKRGGGRFVSRGGEKLAKALEHFHIRVDGYVCIDIGSSTGGFTDCLLQNGARRVVAIDSGSNQLDWRLRNDERVDVRENTNARMLRPEDFSERFDIAVMDVSFISATAILTAIPPLLKPSGIIVCLIKPQFEAKRQEVETGGIVRDPQIHARVVNEVNTFAGTIGLSVRGVIESPLLGAKGNGAKGNKEFLAVYDRKPE